MSVLHYRELTGEIIQAAHVVHNYFGYGLFLIVEGLGDFGLGCWVWGLRLQWSAVFSKPL